MTAQIVYLHGFASGPYSHKATAFRKRFEAMGIPLVVPDLEGGDFTHLTISSQMSIVREALDSVSGKDCALVGSSMGGYLAALTGQLHARVKGLYLMCPGFNVVRRWQGLLADEIRQAEQSKGLIQVFNYRYNKNMGLDPGIFKDAERWEQTPLDRPVPTRIVHGVHDETVDIEESRKYCQSRPWTCLNEVDSDHGLLSHLDWILDDCLKFMEGLGLLKV